MYGHQKTLTDRWQHDIKSTKNHIGTDIQVNIYRVVVCAMCKIQKKSCKKMGGKGHSMIR